VFSQWTGMLKIVSKSLEKQGIKHIQFDGSLTLNNRKKVLDTFRNTSCNVLLMSIKAGSLGINLVEANQVIMLDPWWNIAIESQAVDRVFRIGQTKDVNVVRFVIKGSIEEKVLEIQERKNKIIEKALSGIKGANAKAAKKERMKDIKSLFEIA
jgi:DNA repair protein RAD5